jgi:hypothetical protein
VEEKVIPRSIAHYCFESLPKDGDPIAAFPKVTFHALLNNIKMREPVGGAKD